MSFLLCSCIIWTPYPPVMLNDWSAQEWGDGKKETLNLIQKHHSVGTLFTWCGGAESKDHPGRCTHGELELPFQLAASTNATSLPKAIPALFLTRAVTPGVVMVDETEARLRTFWYRYSNHSLSLFCAGPLPGVSCLCWELSFQPYPHSHPPPPIIHRQDSPTYFPLKIKFKCCFLWEVIPRVHSLLCTPSMGVTPGMGGSHLVLLVS